MTIPLSFVEARSCRGIEVEDSRENDKIEFDEKSSIEDTPLFAFDFDSDLIPLSSP